VRLFLQEKPKSENSFYLLLGTVVSRTFWNGCWKAGNAFWLLLLLLLKNVLVDVCEGGVANENRSSVNNCCWCWTVVCWPLDDDDGCWEKKSVPPKPFPLDEVVAVAWVNAVGDDESLF